MCMGTSQYAMIKLMYENNDTNEVLLVDAENAFNSLNRRLSPFRTKLLHCSNTSVCHRLYGNTKKARPRKPTGNRYTGCPEKNSHI